MRIVVHGAGAVGGFFGGLLARAGQDVHFVARGAQLEALRARGLTIESPLIGRVSLPPLRASAHAADAGNAGLVLVCVKAHQTPGIVEDLSAVVTDETVILTMQNGVESDEVLAARFGRGRVLPAVVYVGATLDAPGVISHVAAGRIIFGSRGDADPSRVAAVRETLASCGQPVRISEDIQLDRWTKLLWNASFNTVSAITQQPPAALLALPETRALLIALMEEVVAVAQAQGIKVRPEDAQAQIAWTEQASDIRTSTMVDRERGRAMETDALLGVVVRKGRERGVPTPASGVVYALLKSVDAHHQPPPAY